MFSKRRQICDRSTSLCIINILSRLTASQCVTTVTPFYYVTLFFLLGGINKPVFVSLLSKEENKFQFILFGIIKAFKSTWLVFLIYILFIKLCSSIYFDFCFVDSISVHL